MDAPSGEKIDGPVEFNIDDIPLPPGVNREDVDVIRATTCLTGQIPGSPSIQMVLLLKKQTTCQDGTPCKDFRILKINSHELDRVNQAGEIERVLRSSWQIEHSIPTEEECVKKITELEAAGEVVRYVFLPSGTNGFETSFLIIFPVGDEKDTLVIIPEIPYFTVICYKYKTTSFEFLQQIAIHDMNDHLQTAQKEFEEQQKRDAQVRQALALQAQLRAQRNEDPEIARMRQELAAIRLQAQIQGERIRQRERERGIGQAINDLPDITSGSMTLSPAATMSRTEMLANGLATRPPMARGAMPDPVPPAQAPARAPALAPEPMAGPPAKRGRGRPKKSLVKKP